MVRGPGKTWESGRELSEPVNGLDGPIGEDVGRNKDGRMGKSRS
jgi:hypothetical protein